MQSAPATQATAYLPAESGRALLVAEGNRSVATIEWAHFAGLAAATNGPGEFMQLDLSLEEVAATSWVRQIMTEWGPDGSVTGRIYRLFALTDRGLELYVEAFGKNSFAFSPALLVLPADVHAGGQWESTGDIFLFDEGSSRPRGEGRYQMRASAAAGGEGCLDVTGTRTINDSAGSESTETWCQGRGITALTSRTLSYRTASDFPDWGDPRRRVTTKTTLEPWAAPAQWQFTQLPYMVGGTSIRADPKSGAVPIGPQLYSFAHAGATLAGVSVAGGKARTTWLASPGGSVLVMASFGEVTVVATTNRELVAYDGSGRWLWTQPTSGIAASLTDLTATTLVVAGTNGTITAHDIATGRLLWQYTEVTDPAVAPVAVPDVGLIVADAGGTVTLLRPDGSEAWQINMQQGIRALAASSEVVAMFRGTDPAMQVVDLDTGTKRWTVQRVTLGTRIVITKEFVYRLANTGVLTTNRVSDGSPGPTLTVPPESRPVTDGTELLLVSRSAIMLATGGVVRHHWNVKLSGSVNRIWVERTARGVVASDNDLTLTLGGAR